MHLWLAHTRHPCKCKHPLSTLKSIWLYMHRGNHTHLEAFVCVYNAQLFHLFWELHFKCTFYQNSNKSMILHHQIASGRSAKLWIEIFFFSQIQKVIAYTNEKLIFQAFHYHSQGNGKKWIIVRKRYFCYLSIDVVVCCRHFFSEQL